MPGEGLLEPLELGPLGEPLDRRHLAARRVDGEEAARADRQAVDEHRARAADLDVARALRAGQPERSRRKSSRSSLGATSRTTSRPLTLNAVSTEPSPGSRADAALPGRPVLGDELVAVLDGQQLPGQLRR